MVTSGKCRGPRRSVARLGSVRGVPLVSAAGDLDRGAGRFQSSLQRL